MQLANLSEEQSIAFDYPYHSDQELKTKLSFLKNRYGDRALRFLDIGGGNGAYVDTLLSEFPRAEAVLVDSSEELLARNRQHPKKRLVRSSFAALREVLGDEKFDVISINWVLHHLVGASRAQSIENAREALALASDLLTPDGILMVAENEYEGFFGTNLPSRIIWTITKNRNPAFVRMAGKFFNTAGVGVSFQSARVWSSLFRRWGYETLFYSSHDRWHHGWKRRAAFAFLMLRKQLHGHFILRPQ